MILVAISAGMWSKIGAGFLPMALLAVYASIVRSKDASRGNILLSVFARTLDMIALVSVGKGVRNGADGIS